MTVASILNIVRKAKQAQPKAAPACNISMIVSAIFSSKTVHDILYHRDLLIVSLLSYREGCCQQSRLGPAKGGTARQATAGVPLAQVPRPRHALGY